MKLKTVSIDKIIPYENNPRNNAEAVDKVAASLKEFGWQQMIVVDKNMVVIAGHTRLLAAKKLGMSEIPVTIASELSEDQVRAYRIADNKTAEMATWNHEFLKMELEALQEADYNLELTGFNMDEIRKELQTVQIIPPAADPDNSSGELPAEPESIQGDLYEIGPHRLLCGDSTQFSDVERLMGDDKASMLFTDPPYGINYSEDQTGRGRIQGKKSKAHAEYVIKNDNLEDLEGFLTNAFSNIPLVMQDDWGGYIFLSDSKIVENVAALANSDIKLGQILIWKKNNHSLSHKKYQQIHEPFLFVGPSSNVKPNGRWFGEHQTTVWEFSKETKTIHPTQKPVELIENAIQHLTENGEIVLDLFGGSGSTMVAAQKTGRRARLMELDPKYCDRIVERMHELWPDLEIKRNGVLIDFDS